jgi:hypothetical protein
MAISSVSGLAPCEDYQVIVRGSAPALAATSICPTTVAGRDVVSRQGRHQP